MLTIIYFLISICIVAVHFVWVSGVMKRLPHISSLHMLSISHVFAALILFWFAQDELNLLFIHQDLLWNILALSLCMLVARLLYYYAFSKADVSEVSIFSSLTPAYTLIIAPLFGYTLALTEMLGVLLISASVYFFFLKRKEDGALHLQDLLSPFHKIISSRPLFYTFLSTFPPAFATIFQKEALSTGSPYLIGFAMCAIIGTTGCMIEMFMRCNKNHQPRGGAAPINIYQSKWIYTSIAGILQAAAIVSISFLITQTHPASMQALLRFAIPLQIILAWMLLKEKKDLKHRLTASLLAILGGYLVLCE